MRGGMRGGVWLAVLLSSLAGSLAAEKSAVHELTEKGYDKFVADNTAFVISFTAPWCGHSRALMPEYEKAAHSLAAQGLPVAHVDGTENEALATRLDVKGYPTIFFVRGDASIEFDGDRKAADLQRWALGKLKPVVPTLTTDAEVDSFVKGKKTALVLFVSALDPTSPLHNAFLAVAAAVEQPCAVSTVTGRITESSPALAMFKTFDGGAPVVMSGELSRSRMQTFAQVESLPLLVEYTSQVQGTHPRPRPRPRTRPQVNEPVLGLDLVMRQSIMNYTFKQALRPSPMALTRTLARPPTLNYTCKQAGDPRPDPP